MPATILRRVDYAPPFVGSGDSRDLVSVPKGTRVWVSLMKRIPADAGTTSTFSVGDSRDNTRYLDSQDCEGADGDLVDGTTTDTRDFWQRMQAGYLYPVADKIRITYSPGPTPGATIPRCSVTLETVQVWVTN